MRRLVAFALLLLPAPALAHGASPSALADALAAQILAECDATSAKTAAVSIAGAPGLEGVPALIAAGRALEDRIFREGGTLSEAAPDAADVSVSLVLSRAGGRVVLGGGVRTRSGRTAWVLASTPETPEWAPWLTGIAPALSDAAGFTWRRAASITGDVLDADGGDLDGDGVAELVAVTRDEVLVLRIANGEATIAARTTLAPTAPAAIATRAPRAFVRVSPGAGSPGELFVRFTDEQRARVLVWNGASESLEARGERDGVVLASRPTARGPDVVAAEMAAGTNHFAEPPKVKRASSWKAPASLGTWLDLRDADLTATARIAEAGPSFALLDADGSLRLLRGDLSEIARQTGCGSAFALADWDADGKADALCAGSDATGSTDSLALETSGGAKWSTTVDGTVVGLAAGPQNGSTAALAFVRDAHGAPGTTLWLLLRSTSP